MTEMEATRARNSLAVHDRNTMPGVLRKMAFYDPLRRAVLNEAADLIDVLREEMEEAGAEVVVDHHAALSAACEDKTWADVHAVVPAAFINQGLGDYVEGVHQ